MKQKILISTVVSAFLLTAAITTQAGDSYPSKSSSANTSSESTAQTQMKSGTSESHDMNNSKMKGNMHDMPMSGDPDKDFAMMMKMHHQKGVEMAQMELKNGKSAEMKAMAKKIIATQKMEIAKFDKFLGNQQQ